MKGISILFIVEQTGGLDTALLYLTADDIDTVLREYKVIGFNLVNLLDKTRVLLIALHKKLILSLLVFTNDSLVVEGVGIIVQLNGTVQLLGQLRSRKKGIL